MVRHATSSSQPPRDRGYRVESPRESDAIGSALRATYSRDIGVPEDMMMLLRKIGGRPATSRDH